MLTATALVLLAPAVSAHDADARGGVMRTHDAGAAWTVISPGIFASGALALAVNPRDPNHLLLAADSGVWRSRNGGRDWDVETPDILKGPAFAAAFDSDGQHALVAGVASLFRDDGDRWQPVRTPAGTAPARALAAGSMPGRVYLAGQSGLYRSDDWGRSWANAAPTLKADHVDALLAPAGQPEAVHALVETSVWSSRDGARHWQRRDEGAPAHGFEAIAVDAATASRLWALGAGQLFRSDQPGERWRAVGTPLPDTLAKALALAISGDVVLISTDRGVFRSADSGQRWELKKEGLPTHASARVLVGDPRSPGTFYAGFALSGYEDLQPRAALGETASSRSELGRAVAAFWLMMLLALGGFAVARTAHKAKASAKGAAKGAK